MSEPAANRPTLGAAASTSIVLTAIRAGVGFGTGVLLARVLGPDGRGDLAYVMTVVAVLVLLANLGVSNALVEARAGGVPATTLYSVASWVGLGTGLAAVTVLLALFVVAGDEALAGLDARSLLATMAVVPPTLALQHWTSVGYIEGRVLRFGLWSAAPNIVFFGAFVVWAAMSEPTTDATIVLWAASLLVPVALLGSRAWFQMGADVQVAMGRIFRFGVRANVAALALVLTWRVDVFMIGALRGPAELGYYAVAVSIAEIVLIAGNAVRSSLGPAQARSERRDVLAGTLAVLIRNGLVLGLVIWVAAWVAGGPVITFVFGEPFAEAAAALTWLVPGVVMLSLQGPVLDYLLTEGCLRSVTVAALAGLIVNVSLNLLLLPRHGFVAASVASTVAYLVSSMLLLVVFRRVAELPVRALFMIRPSDRSVLREQL